MADVDSGMILIISNPLDTHARHVASLLEKRGRRTLILSRADFCAGCTLTLDPVAECGIIKLRDGTQVASESISAVWYRRPGPVIVDPSVCEELDRAFTEKEWIQTLDAFFTAAFRRIVSPPLKQRAALKPLQLRVAASVGLRVAKTLITSDPKQAIDFVATCGGSIIHKAITAPAHRFIDTRAWDAEALTHIETLPLCPTLFQERIHGPGDVRATVVGTQIFAAYLACARGVVDSRLDAAAFWTPYELPRHVASAILRLMEKLGLIFGTIDMKVDDNGEHIFLEVNPQGQFLYIEISTGLPISDALADFLC